MRPYLIVAPGYRHQSNGVRVMHYLCHRLNQMDVPAFIVLCDGNQTLNPNWKTPLATQDHLQDGIVVYPEIISDNPLRSPRVVRWLLNRPGYITGQQINFMPDDYVVTFSSIIDPTKPVFQISTPLHELFNPHFLPAKTEQLYYVGKGDPSQRVPTMELFKTEITRTWPSTQHELADLLRRARVLFTYDTLSSLNLEATLCGTLVVVIPTAPYTRADLERSEYGMNGIAWGCGARRNRTGHRHSPPLLSPLCSAVRETAGIHRAVRESDSGTLVPSGQNRCPRQLTSHPLTIPCCGLRRLRTAGRGSSRSNRNAIDDLLLLSGYPHEVLRRSAAVQACGNPEPARLSRCHSPRQSRISTA